MSRIVRAPGNFFLAGVLLMLDCSGRTASDVGNGGSSSAGASAQAGAGASGGASAQAGASGQSGAGGDHTGTGMFCGIETCEAGSKCCPATGRCYDPQSSGCVGIGCAVPEQSCAASTDAGTPPTCAPAPPGNLNCCGNGLLFCETNNSCYYPGCENCCPPNIECNQQADCPSGFACCYNSRRCYNPQLDSCSNLPPKCASDGSCPGDMICCTEHGTCYEPGCSDCCPTSCAPATAHCSQELPCCSGTCCSGVPIPTGQEYCAAQGSSCPISDRNAKQDIVAVDADRLLERVIALPISEWSYKTDPSVRHIGPMAQDFHGAFATGGDDKCIPSVDENGVALAAIQALYQRVERLDRESQALRNENAELRRELQRSRRR